MPIAPASADLVLEYVANMSYDEIDQVFDRAEQDLPPESPSLQHTSRVHAALDLVEAANRHAAEVGVGVLSGGWSTFVVRALAERWRETEGVVRAAVSMSVDELRRERMECPSDVAFVYAALDGRRWGKELMRVASTALLQYRWDVEHARDNTVYSDIAAQIVALVADQQQRATPSLHRYLQQSVEEVPQIERHRGRGVH